MLNKAALSRVLDIGQDEENTCYQMALNKKYFVNVAVTTLWSEPNKLRKVDGPSTTDPVNILKWKKDMSHEQKLWLLGKIDSQALYGDEVTIVESKGDWYKIAVKDQGSPKNSKGYPGWVPKSHIAEQSMNYEGCSIAIVAVQKTNLYHTASVKDPFLEISFNTILPITKEGKQWVIVQTPKDGEKYMKTADVKVAKSFESIPKPEQQDLLETGKMFLGLSYLWAGTSGYGFDCSGFTYSIYKQHGILLPRDSTAQAQSGISIRKKDLQPGDLLFFAYNKGKGNVHHVAMYVGGGKMIHSPNYSRSIEIISVNVEPYKSEFSGAKRYLQ